jgi:hypothetical protein
MKTLEPIGDYTATILDDRLRKLLSSRKQGREFRSVAGYYRDQPVLHARETELNREFDKGATAGRNWFFIALTFLAALHCFWLRIDIGFK